MNPGEEKEKKEEHQLKVELVVNYDGGPRFGKGCNYFNNLQELKSWCEKNPELASVLGYVKKK